MAEQKMYGLDERGNELWEKITRDYLAGRLTNRPPRPDKTQGPKGRLRIRRGLLTSDLAQPAGFVATPTTATGQPYRVATVGGTPASDGDPITLYNYHPSISGVIGDYFVADWKDGMWQVLDVQCTPE